MATETTWGVDSPAKEGGKVTSVPKPQGPRTWQMPPRQEPAGIPREERSQDLGTRVGTGSRAASAFHNQIASLLAAPGGLPQILSVHYLRRDSQGRPVYRITYKRHGQRPIHGVAPSRTYMQTFAYTGSALVAPNYKSSAVPGRTPDAGPATGGTELDRAKNIWINWVQGQNLPEDFKNNLLVAIGAFEGSMAELNLNITNSMRSAGLWGPPQTDDGLLGEDFLLDGGGGGGGGFGGGGFGGPAYMAPDARVIEDMAKGMSLSLLGTINEAHVQEGVNAYMRDHRRAFDSMTEEIDPSQSMLEAFRATENYRTIHALRPDTEDERSWISQRRMAAEQGGLAGSRQEDFAIAQATTGGDIDDVRRAASFQQLQHAGRAPAFLDQQFRQTAQMMLSGLRR